VDGSGDVRALVWQGGQELTFGAVPDPSPSAGDAIVKVEVAGICGSDVHGYRGHPGPRVPPLILGHEAVGTVDGQRVVIYPLAGCGECSACLAGEDNLCPRWELVGMHKSGVFAERVSVPERSLVSVPAGMHSRLAVLAEPLACCVGALRPHRVGSDTRVVVIGCGPIGLLTVYLAARAGARVTAVDPVAERRSLAAMMGAQAHTPGSQEADLVIDAAGFAPTWHAAIEAVRSGGQVVVVGLGQSAGEIPMATVVRRAVQLRGQFAYTRTDFAQAVEILNEGDLDTTWLTDRNLAEGASAFADLVAAPARFSKVLLWP
jgi:threonine dehydrogenase-like Zn-dependent dehydrogenase